MTTRLPLGGWCAGVFAALAFAAPIAAQLDSRWTPFVGCWVPAGGGEEAGLLCFRPAGAGVEMFNVVEGEVTAAEPFVADGVARPITAEGCTGNERVEFSEDGLRVYTRSAFTCGTESRTGTGVMSFVSPSEWIDVRSVTVSGDPVAWAQHYEMASASLIEAQGVTNPPGEDQGPGRAARMRAARGLEVAHVQEAAARIEARAVEVWVAAHETEFDLSGSELVGLADAGVPESVIDVMIAVYYPDRFVVSPEGAADEADPRMAANDYPVGYRRGYRSYLFDPFYSPFGYGRPYSRFGYSRFGYYGSGFGGYGGYGGYWGYIPATIIVEPVGSGGGEPRGRMVPGRGYTRDLGNSGASGGNSGGSSARPERSSSSGNGGGGDSGGGGGGGGGGSSSDSGSSGSTGRRAQPRN